MNEEDLRTMGTTTTTTTTTRRKRKKELNWMWKRSLTRLTALNTLDGLLLLVLILFSDLSTVEPLRNPKQSLRNGQTRHYGINRSLKSGALFPSVFNVATKSDVYVNATCGDDGPETFCKPSESTRCAVCDPNSPDHGKRHDISSVIDSNHQRWWQSPTLARGDRYEYVTITLDLKQVYQIAYVIVKSANTPRPAAWILERSLDGLYFYPWQYYAPTDEECWTRYSVPPVTGKPIYLSDNEVVCTSSYSRVVPMENGEIHTYLVNGRPGAFNHSKELEEFTQSRYVRLRLQGLGPIGETIVDKRRAFYSIKEINIGGHCICSGHASHCRYSVQHDRQECECERHTCGERCNKCCPMYNQVPWRPGTINSRGFYCEKCNCHGHATACRYDPDIADQRSSLDIRDKYRGGGVCINCTEHTTGINCEKCELGYYRPNGVPPNASQPCLPCTCDSHGSTGLCTPDDSFNRLGKVAGSCECKPGYSGHKCDQCAAGYRQFPDCTPCPCDSRGILPSHDCEGDCLCKVNVEGELCERCKPGYFALTRDNQDGCLSCVCSGLSRRCVSADISYQMISSLDGWLIADKNASRHVLPEIDFESNSLGIDSSIIDYTPYWLAPNVYLGNRLTSYGSNITFAVTWVVMRGDSSGKPTNGPDVIIIGKNGMRIAYGEERYSGQDATISVPLTEIGWYHLKEDKYYSDSSTRYRRTDFSGDPVTRNEFVNVIADVRNILIRAKYHSEQIEGRFLEAVLTIGEPNKDQNNNLAYSLIEKCECPTGYAGLSCESCAWGYVKLYSNFTEDNSTLSSNSCVKCGCNGHSKSCDLDTGECSLCEHNTVGPKCDRCKTGYYGYPSRGKEDDCKPCACPLDTESNNFSPSCKVSNNDVESYVCTQCPEGYTGDHCESCGSGYFGDPTKVGQICERCSCNGGTCDSLTGTCLECRGNTEGSKCEICKEKHYGDPFKLNCDPCECDPLGSSSSNCDPESGQCPCKPLFTGRTCSRCVDGFGNVTAGCQECDCRIGSANKECDSVTGQCQCLPGVEGDRCDRCENLHYGIDDGGCLGCHCNPVGSTSHTCNIVTGQCQCKNRVTGRTCDRCQTGYWGIVSGSGCAPCECDPLGSLDSSCDEDTGRCRCRPGVGGPRCDACLPGYYGFSEKGCRVCEPCNKRGHKCDQETGRCLCPALTIGENCDRCRSGAYGFSPGEGCKSCSCTTGAKKTQCDNYGQCQCRDGFDGLRCERCALGYYGYPRCKPCACHSDGTKICDEGVTCLCDEDGQCPCKENVVGRRCNECRNGTFGLAFDNPNGCTECFCFGRSDSCTEARLGWGQRRIPRPRIFSINDTIDEITVNNFGIHDVITSVNDRLDTTDGVYVIPGTEGDVTLPSNFYFNHPLYWLLPESFLGDKVVSYGGYIEFSTVTKGGDNLRSNKIYPEVIIQGNDRIVLEHYDDSNFGNKDRRKIRLHESLWRLKNEPSVPVSRETLMIALQKVQKVLIKATDRTDFVETTLLEASIDAAVLTPTRSPPFANDVEICKCPKEYNNTSCQDPSDGYYRWHSNKTAITKIVIELIGEARPCECNGRSSICEMETGHCLECSEYTSGKHCDICEDSFYGDPFTPDGCKPCPCPHADKRFSSTCEIHSENDVLCHCKPGYTGKICERCSFGYYGRPTKPGGSCLPCNCNPAGSFNDECLEESGQCNCRAGSTGRDCSQCTEARHVFIGDFCTSCDDNCTGILLDKIDNVTRNLIDETVHIANGYIPPPWEELSRLNDNATILFDDLKSERKLRHRVKNIPWRDYRKLKNKANDLIDKASNCFNRAITHKSRSDDIRNNMYSSQLEVENIKKSLKDSVSILSNYGNEESKYEIENAVREATIILKRIKTVDLSLRVTYVEYILSNATDYIDWLESLDDGSYDLMDIKNYAEVNKLKEIEFRMIVEKLMEDLFTYDGIYEDGNRELRKAEEKLFLIDKADKDIRVIIDDGETIVDEAKGFSIDSQNNFEDLPDFKYKLFNLSDALTNKEGILYRLNYEYEDKFVIPAKEHAKNLSDYVDYCESLFAETRDQAVNPLKASEAYKNIVDGLKEAKKIGEEAKIIAEEIHDKIFPGGVRLASLLNYTNNIFEKSTDLLNEAKKQQNPSSYLSDQLEEQKRGIVNLKDTMNGTGIKDNEINVKLREIKSGSVESMNRLNNIMKDNRRVMESFDETAGDIEEYEDLIANDLKEKLKELKRDGDSKISLASEKLTEAQSNIKKADGKLISLTNASVKRKNEFDKWNATLSEKLRYLKDKIAEARNTADGIRISLKSVDGRKCTRSYRPNSLQPGTTTTIVMTLALTAKHRQGSLFYLPSSLSDDFIALEMVNRRIRFLWNVGGGTGVVTHPEVLEPGDIKGDNSWYRIEAVRTRNIGELSVRKQISYFGREYLAVRNETSPEYGRFDVTPGDRVWLGGIPESQTRPAELLASNGLPGCVHQVIVDGKQIGIWNFVSTAPDMACEACVEGVEDARDDVAYSFNGDGYAVRNRVHSAPYDKYTFGVSINFRTFDEDALLFLAVNPNNSQHIMIYLREGRVVLHIGYGGNASMEMLSMGKYNDGNWTKIDAFRQYQTAKGIEQCSLSVGGGNNDRKIGAPTPQPKKNDLPDLFMAKYYIGGVPPSFKSADKISLPSPVSFLGCMSNIFIQEGYDPMAEQYFGVEPSCGNKHVKIVGFYGNGYYEHNARTLKKKSSSFSFSFRTLQNDAILLLSTFKRPSDEIGSVIDDPELNESYYSISVIGGQIQLRMNAGKGEILLQTNDTFNDGKYHSVSVTKKRKEVELRVDDAYQTAGRLPTGAAVRAPDFTGGLFLGGLPGALNDTLFVSTNVPLAGAIKDFILDDEVYRMNEPVSFERAAIGRPGPSMGKDYAMQITSASLSRGMSTQPEGCRKVPYYSLEPGALKFGDKPHSHTQLYLIYKKFWDKKYSIEFDFRTYYPNGLLFIIPGTRLKHHLMMVVRNGQLSMVTKNNKQRKEISFKNTLNDGNWHRVVVNHDDRRLTMSVDNQTPQMIKVQKRISLAPMMYIGGLPESGTPIPEQIVAKLETLKGCIRGLRVNDIIRDMVGSDSRAYNVGQCFPSVESGAYFQDDAYAIYKRNFELGALLELQLEFRTSEFTGVLLSITGEGGSPSLSLELYNGKIIMSSDLGEKNPLYVEQHFPSQYAVCDNRWHRIQALFNDEQLALKVDELDQKYGLPLNGNYHSTRENVTSSPLYIGGLPEPAPKGTLITRDNFNGCIRNVMIDGERRDWTDMTELHNIHLSSCPVQQ